MRLRIFKTTDNSTGEIAIDLDSIQYVRPVPEDRCVVCVRNHVERLDVSFTDMIQAIDSSLSSLATQ